MNNYNSSRRQFLNDLLKISVASAAFSGLGNIISCVTQPYGDKRLEEPHPYTMVPTTDVDQRFMESYVNSLVKNHLKFTSKFKIGNKAFIVYDVKVDSHNIDVVTDKLVCKDGKVNCEKKDLDLYTKVQLIHMGMLSGKELSGQKFEAHGSLDSALESLKEEHVVLNGIPYVVTGTALIPTPTAVSEFNIKVEGDKKIVKYKQAQLLEVQLDDKRVIGLYPIDKDVIDFANNKDKNLEKLGVEKNALNTYLFRDNKKLREGLMTILRASGYSEDYVDEIMGQVGRSTTYLLDSRFSGNVLLDVSQSFNDGKISLADLAKLKIRTIAKKELNEKTFEQEYPSNFENQFSCLELYVEEIAYDAPLRATIFRNPKNKEE